MEIYDNLNPDVQATKVEPLPPESFDFEAYENHEAKLSPFCLSFHECKAGIAVYRRFRVKEVFSYGCRDMERSLKLQLGALQKSLVYKTDIPNFLEPWYGIGIAASAFDAEYHWLEGQAPVIKPIFNSVKEALSYPVKQISKTNIGRYTLNTIEYFLDKTKGRLPISLTDVQSPLNVVADMIGINTFLMDLMDDPDSVRKLLLKTAIVIKEFIDEQLELIGSNLVKPGHGFASSRFFEGLGMSDDYMLMLSPSQYKQVAMPAMLKMAESFSGPVFHSCGNWTHLATTIRSIPGLKMADGAFGGCTDPSPNDAEEMANVFEGTGITLNARIVGNPEIILKNFKLLWRKDMKLILVTYCDRPEEQEYVYKKIHDLVKTGAEDIQSQINEIKPQKLTKHADSLTAGNK